MASANRRLRVESLEDRRLLAADLHNFLAPLDVNDDGRVSALDGLLIINHLNSQDRSYTPSNSSSPFLDVTDDGRVSAIDALAVINELNRGRLDSGSDWVRMGTGDGPRAAVLWRQVANGAEIEIRVRGAAGDLSHAVFLEDTWIGNVQTDQHGRGRFQLEPQGAGWIGQLPEVLTRGRAAVRVAVESIGEVVLRNERGDSPDPNDSEYSDRLQRANVFAARLVYDGQTRGHALFAEHRNQSFLGVFARGLSADRTYDVQIDGVSIATLKANRHGVVAERIDTSSIRDLPEVQSGSLIILGEYTGQFISLTAPPQPQQTSIYHANFAQDRVRGNAMLTQSTEFFVIGLRLGRTAPGSIHDLWIDDVKIAEVRADQSGWIEFRYDSRRGESLVAELPPLRNHSQIRVGTLAHARLVKLGRQA